MSLVLHLPRARTLALVLAAAATAACDRIPEQAHVEAIRALCADLAARGAGATEAERLLGRPSWTACATDLPPASSEDRCPRDGTELCLRVWAYRAHDEALCGGLACSYGCELRAPAGDAEATCSFRFFDGTERPPPPLP